MPVFQAGEVYWSLRVAAKCYGVDPRTLLRHAKTHGLARRLGRSWRIPRDALLKSLYHPDMPPEQGGAVHDA